MTAMERERTAFGDAKLIQRLKKRVPALAKLRMRESKDLTDAFEYEACRLLRLALVGVAEELEVPVWDNTGQIDQANARRLVAGEVRELLRQGLFKQATLDAEREALEIQKLVRDVEGMFGQ